ncbi:MAG: hypothetical protein P1U88_13380 [Thalassobaculaceae bacterium]|nr:hypothetical protein [Thalassobaculaceae bacterium]
MTAVQVRWLKTAAITAALFLSLAPLSMTLPGDGLDPAWGLVVEQAALRGAQWGRDIVFTFGPYGYHYQRIFHPDLAAEILAMSSLRALLTGLGISFALREAGPGPTGIAVAAALVSLPTVQDSTYFLLPLLIVLLHFQRRATTPLWYLLLAAAYCGFAALIKTTFAVLAIALLLVVDIDRLLDRRLPVFTPLCLIVALAAYLAAGQSLAALPEFIDLSLDVARGFSHAMSVFDWRRAIELTAFLVASMTVLALVVATTRPADRLRTRSGRLMLLAVAIFWFVTYKAGFTRHDLHTLVSWATLGTGAALFAAVADGAPSLRPRRLLLVAALAIAILAPIRLSLAPGFGLVAVALQTLVYNPRDTVAQAAAILAAPTAWMAEMQRRRAVALTGIRNRNPLTGIQGSIDTVPSLQAALVAADLADGPTYHPRPIFQEYSTYTAALIAANRAFFDSDEAPDTILLSPGSIDNRYPSLAEGPLWPILLRRYADAGLAGPMRHLDGEIDVLVLNRRDQDTVIALGAGQSMTIRPGERLTLPEDDVPVVAMIDISQTVAGQVLTVLHQTPTITLTVTLADGSRHTHRLIPDIARAGFLLSPYLPDTAAARHLFDGDGGGRRRVSDLRIDVPDPVAWAFADRIAVTLRPLR